ncbi:hypothetical protein BJF90_36115 [Pseudonocardia sp. CNS-004]|nr:hypothetical protein BJF90_36115 [Pseudonocardia sp. CNS-004]
MSVQAEATSTTPAVRGETLRVEGLSGGFRSAEGGFTEILKSVSFSIETGTITAVVGETGSGKSMTALAVIGLLPKGFHRTAGAVHFEGHDLLTLAPAQLRALRGDRIGMVFQDARAR